MTKKQLNHRTRSPYHYWPMCLSLFPFGMDSQSNDESEETKTSKKDPSLNLITLALHGI